MADRELLDKLTTARVGLLLKHPFFGNLATRMPLIDASDWCQTAATDGRRFFYSADFVNSLDNQELEFLFCHEILHCVLDHFGRTGDRHKMLSNIAQDYVINQILVDENIGKRITSVDICLDPKYRGMAWEEVYDLLIEKTQFISMEELLEQLGDLLDEHLDADDGGKDGKQENESNSKKPKISREELEKIKEEFRHAMIQAAQTAAGKLPAGVERIIKDLTEPKLNWRDLLRLNIQSVLKSDYSFQRFNKKSQGGVVIPGLLHDDAVEIGIAIDLSGSISDKEAKMFLSEVKGILDSFQDYIVTLWCFDTEVYNVVEITPDTADEFYSYQPKGGGGTYYRVNFEYIVENELDIKKLIIFGDGYDCCSDLSDFADIDTLFLITDNKNYDPGIGEIIWYEEVE